MIKTGVLKFSSKMKKKYKRHGCEPNKDNNIWIFLNILSISEQKVSHTCCNWEKAGGNFLKPQNTPERSDTNTYISIWCNNDNFRTYHKSKTIRINRSLLHFNND